MKILILSDNSYNLYKFSREFIESLLKSNYEVYISIPNDQYVTKIIDIGCHIIETKLFYHDMNPVTNLLLYVKYKSILKEVKPDIVFTYTFKPNIYGGMACQSRNARR